MNNITPKITMTLFVTLLTVGCDQSDSQSVEQHISDALQGNKCDALLSYVDSLPSDIVRRLENGMILPNGEIIPDGMTVKVDNVFLRPKSNSECEIYCPLSKDGSLDSNKCHNLRQGLEAIIKNKKG